MSDELVIHKLFANLAHQFPERVCFQIKKDSVWEEWTYKDTENLSLRIGSFLVREGFQKGDFAVICMENRPEWAAIYLGIMFAGLTCVPLDPQLTEHEIETIINDCGAKILFTSHRIFLEKIVHKIKKGLSKIVIVDMDVEEENLVGLAQVKSSLPKDAAFPEVFPEDVASLIYTSGTTDKPKGVMLTHKNFCSNFRSIYKLKLFSDKDNFISILPLHHSYPFMVTLLTPLLGRARITYASSLRSDELLKLMQEAGVTVLVGVPQLFYMFYTHILEGIKKIPFFIRMPLLGLIEILWQIRRLCSINLNKLLLSKIHSPFGKSLRFFASGGAKLNEEATRFLVKTGFTILEGYGLTETSPVTTFNPLKKQKIGSAGRVIPDVEIKIANPDEKGEGEIAIKGLNVMKGYYKRDEETLSVLRDGWFYSGDLGHIDKEGYLFITGRQKEIIVLSSGKNIYPEEIESHYIKSSYIKEICVLGVGGTEEEKLCAVVVPDTEYCRKTTEVNLYEKLKWELESLSEGLAAYKRIKGFIVAKEELPRTRLGKMKRYEIKYKYQDELKGVKLKDKSEETPATDEELKVLSSDVGRKVIEALKKHTKLERRICLVDHLELDLGIDSLTRVELEVALERSLNIPISNELMAKVFTVKELILEIEKLSLGKEVRKDAVLKVSNHDVWSDILKIKPSEDVLKKLDLSPGFPSRLAVFLFAEMSLIVFKIFWRLKIVGAKNIPRKGAYILCANHGSYMDGFIICASVPAILRKELFFVGFEAFFKVFLLRNMIKIMRVIPIDPGVNLVEAMQFCAHALRNDKIVCIFPEGNRTPDGEVKEFKKGIGILAKELNVPLLPVYISGSYESWPRTKTLPRLHPIRIIFGKPFAFEELKKEGLKLGAQDDYEAIALGIREEVIKLKNVKT